MAELYASACVLSRADAELLDATPSVAARTYPVAELCLRRSLRRVRRWLAKLHENDDEAVTAAADAALRREGARPRCTGTRPER